MEKPPIVPELLAPAGSPAMLLAALRCGADAVYLGGDGFNARGSAGNFSLAQLEEAIAACKLRGVKAYFTLNTLVSDRELPAALALAESAVSFGADAIIVQDLGLLRLLHERYPTLPLHASTQCSTQTAAGMAMLCTFGVTRAVVPRECTAAELEALLRDAPLELEVFVHGALCVSVSGQCRMSAALGDGQRSANHGTCAQPCRLPFTPALSLKDLSLLSECACPPLNRVAAFKIEGRQKRPEYAAAAVTAFRQAIDGAPPTVTKDELRQAFSRSGFTQGYYEDRRGADMFGTRRQEDIAPPELLRRLAGLYAEQTPCVPLTLAFTGEIGQSVRLRARTSLGEATVTGEVLQSARQAPLAEEDVRRQLGKLGGTPYRLDEIMVDLPAGAFLPLGQISALRRKALEALEAGVVAAARDAKKTAGHAPMPASPMAESSASGRMPALYLRFQSHQQLPEELPGSAKLLLPVETPPDTLANWSKRMPVAVTIPAAIFGAGPEILARLREAAACGITEAMAHTPDGIALALEAGLIPLAGEGMNLCNGAALHTAAALGVAEAMTSPECVCLPEHSAQIRLGALAYGRLSLMLCRALSGTDELTDRKGLRFPIRYRNGCAEVLNSRPLWLADRLERLRHLPLDFLLLSFTVESPAECAEVLRAYREGGPPPGVFTRGALRGL